MSIERRSFIKLLGGAFAAAGVSQTVSANTAQATESGVRMKFAQQKNLPNGNYQLRYWSRRPKDVEWIARDVPVLVVDGAEIQIDIPFTEGEKIASASLEYLDGD